MHHARPCCVGTSPRGVHVARDTPSSCFLFLRRSHERLSCAAKVLRRRQTTRASHFRHSNCEARRERRIEKTPDRGWRRKKKRCRRGIDRKEYGSSTVDVQNSGHGEGSEGNLKSEGSSGCNGERVGGLRRNARPFGTSLPAPERIDTCSVRTIKSRRG